MNILAYLVASWSPQMCYCILEHTLITIYMCIQNIFLAKLYNHVIQGWTKSEPNKYKIIIYYKYHDGDALFDSRVIR